MKVALVGQDMVGQGVQYVTAMTARMFVKWGWEVDIVLSQVHLDLLKEGKKPFEVPPQVRFHYLASRRSSRNILSLRKYLKQEKPDIVIAESGLYSWCLRWASFGIPKSKLPKMAQVVHGNGGLWDITRTWQNRLKYTVKHTFLYSKYDVLMTVNEEMVKTYKFTTRYLKNFKIYCVNNACCDEVYQKKVKLPPTHPWLVNKECPTFVTAGSYTPGKCHMMLLRAFNKVENQRRARLIIYGIV